MAQPKTKKTGKSESRIGLLNALGISLNPGSRKNPGLPAKIAIVFLIALLVVLFLPFLRSAFHIDDPLFIWSARHIQGAPGNPYGFAVNWYGSGMQMSEVTKNPPLASYYIALAALALGWSEPALHVAFMAAAVAVAIGSYLIATRFCARPLVAVLAGVLTPVFFVSSLTVMCDVLMLAFWVFATYFWMKGLDSANHRLLALAGVFIAASAITKYFGMTLVPLLLVYSIFRKRAVGWYLAYLAIPAAILAFYQWKTHQLYGRGLLLDAAAYATDVKSDFSTFPFGKTYIDLAFTGGCLASILFFARQLWSRAAIVGGVLFAVAAAFILFKASAIGAFTLPTDSTEHLLLAIQMGLWGTAGISLLVLASLDLIRERDANSLFLFLWSVGTFLFAGFINWTTNGRSILPMTIPAGILIARRLELRADSRRNATLPPTVLPLAAALVLAFVVGWADTALADTARIAATRVHESWDQRGVWFQGHWGFQYYMEQIGAKPVDVSAFRPSSGDVVVVPGTNTNLFELPAQWPKRQAFEVSSTHWISTMNSRLGAGFYADVFGPLPFVIGRAAPERFEVFEIVR